MVAGMVIGIRKMMTLAVEVAVQRIFLELQNCYLI